MIKKGIDRIRDYDPLLKNKRLGLITSISGVDTQLLSTVDIMNRHYHLTALFAPEHGIRGEKAAGENMDGYIDQQTGIKVYSLYSDGSKRLTKAMLDEVDAVVYDIQDLGVRYYTFISTLIYALEDCGKHQKELIVLDRPNPLGGYLLEGNVLQTEYKSFVGAYPLPVRYGLTIGELALLVNKEEGLNCQVIVIPVSGWNRKMTHADTKDIWIMPSPGMPRYETALLYSGMCLIEGTNVSEGRGTACPFEMIGAPFIQAKELTDCLRQKKLPGLKVMPAYFTPSTSKYKGMVCEGVHLHISDQHIFQSFKTGLCLIECIKNLYPNDFRFLSPTKGEKLSFIEKLMGSSCLNEKEWTTDQVLAQGKTALNIFERVKIKYHLYE